MAPSRYDFYSKIWYSCINFITSSLNSLNLLVQKPKFGKEYQGEALYVHLEGSQKKKQQFFILYFNNMNISKKKQWIGNKIKH